MDYINFGISDVNLKISSNCCGNRFPDLAMVTTSQNPSKSMHVTLRIAMNPDIIHIVCHTSVHTTAFMPPITV